MDRKIKLATEKYCMHEIYEGAILGFSGGADSSALLHYLKDKAKKLLCVHINHMIRGEEAKRDERFCREICEKYGVELLTYEIDIPKIAREKKQGLEQTAREERYKILYSLLDKYNEYKCIITAHNADDNTETVVFNLTRGSGTNGIGGIKAVQNKVMRPLILASKTEIFEYCEKNSISYVTDSTNYDTEYTRNHIRHKIIPELKKINPSLNDAISRLCDIVKSDEDYFDNLAEEIYNTRTSNGKIEIEYFNSLHPSLKARVLVKMAGVSLDHKAISSSIALASKGECGKKVNLNNGVSFKVEHNYLCFVKTKALERTEFYHTLEDGINIIPEIDKIILLNTYDVIQGYEKEAEYFLNKEALLGTLYVRNKRDGDTILSGKMTKKLKKVLCDLHIPSHTRDKVPVLCDDNGILLVSSIIKKDDIDGKDIKIIILKRTKNTEAKNE